ncbi:MAG: hypothetical protein M3186_03380 [Actinomycetota bacterium]|nr:hypothetical protein [Actinomycetota bacterium]
MSGEATASVTAALLGLDGFSVLVAADAGGELELLVEATADVAAESRCERRHRLGTPAARSSRVLSARRLLSSHVAF